MAHSRKDCITFFMTTQCNLECSYCYLKDSNLPRQSISVAFAKAGLRDYFAQNTSHLIRFFGAGEPTLEIDKIIEIRDYAYDLAGKDLVCEIQTNGVFSERVAEWLSMHMDIVWFSFDGPAQYNDLQRYSKNGRSVSNIIEKNIKHLVSIGKDMVIGVRPTITELTVSYQEELIDYLYSLGVKVIYSDPVFPPVNSDANRVAKIPSYPDFLIKYAENYLLARERAASLGIFYGSILAINFDEPTDTACRSCLPSPHLTTDGYVTCCDMSYMKGILPGLVYGKYDSLTDRIDYDQQKIKNIRLRRAANLVECRGCEVLYNCAGGCLGEGLNETGRLLGVKKDYCEAIRFLAKHMSLNQGLYPYLHP